jgi:hypothetical protein
LTSHRYAVRQAKVNNIAGAIATHRMVRQTLPGHVTVFIILIQREYFMAQEKSIVAHNAISTKKDYFLQVRQNRMNFYGTLPVLDNL